MYQQVIDFVKKEGAKLALLAGTAKDHYNQKQWTTEHDHAIEHRLNELIQTFGPSHSLYSEGEYTTFSSSKDVWIVDPISHTLRFIHGMPHYAIVVSHLHEGEIVFACIYDPSMKELFTAEKGKGAYLNSKQIYVKKAQTTPAILYNPYPLGKWTIDESLSLYQKLVTVGFIETAGSMGLTCAYIAAGRAQLAIVISYDAFPFFAGKLLVDEAGGTFSDLEGNDLTLETTSIIAGEPSLYKKAMKILSQNIT